MTDRVDHQFTNADSQKSSEKLYLDAYNLKSTPDRLPANTEDQNATTMGSGKELTRVEFADKDSATKDSPNKDSANKSQPWVLYDFGGPADQAKTQDRSKPTDRKTEANRPEVRLRPGEKIQDAINRAPDGATVMVPAGVYNERLNITRDNITLKADGKAVLDLQNRPRSAPGINISDRKNVTIDGFEIRNVRGGDTPTAIRVDGSSENIKIINNDIHHVESNSNAHGIGVFGTKANPLKNITISNNKLHDLKLGQSESLVLNGNIDGFKITDNSIYNSDNIGIDIIGGEGVGRAGVDRARNGLIARNRIDNIDTARNPTYSDRNAAGIYIDGGKNVVVEDNTVTNSNYGIELASERKGWNTEGITVSNNRISGSHLAAITLGGGSARNGGVTDSVVENNDLRGNSRPIWRQNNVGNVTIRNNRTR